ncbi:MAG: hypothetical protein ACHQT9_02115 [Candidatus Saccharimonadales bacterium]
MAKMHATDKKHITFFIVVMASVVFLIPWTIWIFNALPDRAVVRSWDLAWTGFDIFLSFVLFCTAVSAYRKSTWTVTLAPVSAVLLIVDAWFDVTTASTVDDHATAVVTAVFAEIPLALVCIVAALVAHNTVTKSNKR